MSRLRVVVAGAGAVVESCHLPAARCCRDVQIVALADQNPQRVRILARRFGIRRTAADYRDLAAGVDADAALIALPNYLHAPAAVRFMAQGLHVLVEKPMALTAHEARTMMDSAVCARVVLAVGLIMRHMAGARWIKQAVESAWLGPVRAIEIEHGGIFSWRHTSGFAFRKKEAGGGVLIDVGSHLLDLLIWWLGRPVLAEYRDDAMGGVEAECEVRLLFPDRAPAATCRLSLSRLRRMSNTVRICGARRVVEWDMSADRLNVLSIAGRIDHGADGPAVPPRRPAVRLFAEQLQMFARAAAGLGEPASSGAAASATVDLIDRCYRERRELTYDWTRPALTVRQRIAGRPETP